MCVTFINETSGTPSDPSEFVRIAFVRGSDADQWSWFQCRDDCTARNQRNTVIPDTHRIISCHANILAVSCYLTPWTRYGRGPDTVTHIASSYNEPPLELARLLEYEYDRCYPTMSYHDLRDQKLTTCLLSSIFVCWRIRDMIISELVNNDGSAMKLYRSRWTTL